MTSQIISEATTSQGPDGSNNSTAEEITSSVYGQEPSTLEQGGWHPNQLITSFAWEDPSTLKHVTHLISLDITSSVAAPEADTTSNSDSEPEVELKTSAWPESPENNLEGGGVPEGEPPGNSEDRVASEPVPDWVDAKQNWGIAWQLYTYITGCLFLVITLYTLLSLIRLSNKRNLVSKAYFISLNLMLCLMGSTRAVYFLVDAYNSNGTFPHVIALLLFGTTFPCLSGAFSLQFLALLQTLRVNLMRPKVQKLTNLAMVIAFNFFLSITADIIVGLYQNAKVYMLVCQIILTLWGLYLSAAYFFVFKKLLRVAKKRQKELQHSTPTKGTQTLANSTPREKPKLTMKLALKVTLVTGVLGGAIVVLQVYSMIEVYGVLSQSAPEAWPWWAYQLVFRTVELLMAFTMVYVASQPIRYTKAISSNHQKRPTGGHCSVMVYLMPCYRLFWPTTKLDGNYEGEELKWLEHSQKGLDSSNGVYNQYRTFPAANRNGNNSNGNNINKTGSLQTSTNKPPPGHTHEAASTSADTIMVRSHHHSMLVNEGGYIRFREDGDPIQDALTSTDDDELNYAAFTRNTRKHRSLIWERMGLKKLSADQCLDTSSESSSHQNWLSYKCQKRHHQCRRSTSVPNTSSNTPMGFLTPKSLCSTDFDGASSFSFKPPSSIHLRDSIDKALNYFHFGSKDANLSSQNLSDCTSKTPDSLGSNNPCFKCDQYIMKSGDSNSQSNLTNKSVAGSQLKQSKTHLLCQNLAELRSRGASTLSLDAEIERASSSEPNEDDLAFSEISKKASLCRSNSDIIFL